jgi:uncharacterized protein (DUF2164 family)
MPIELSKEEIQEIVPSIRRYFREELEQEISEMQAKFMLEFFLAEIAPLAYNKGVKDAEAHLRRTVEDLPSVCFEDALTYWRKKKR